MTRRDGLAKSNAIALLQAAASSGDNVVTMSAIRAITGLGTTSGAWRAISPLILETLDVPPGSHDRVERLELMAAVPLASAHQRLTEIANDAADPDNDLAAGLLAALGLGLAATKRIRKLIEKVRKKTRGPALQELALSPIEHHEVPKEVFEFALGSTDGDARFWAAIAVARLGVYAPLDQVLRDMHEGQVPSVLRDDPQAGYDTLSAAPLIPGKLQRHLLRLQVLGYPARVVVSALTGGPFPVDYGKGEQYVRGQQEEETSTPALRPSAAKIRAAKQTAQELLSTGRARNWQADLGVLYALPPADAGRLVTDLISAGGTSHNQIMDVLQHLNTSRLPVRQLISHYATGGSRWRMNTGEVAFVLSNCNASDVMQSFGSQLQTAEGTVQEQLNVLLQHTLAQPAYGEHWEIGTPTELIDDLSQLTAAEPSFDLPVEATGEDDLLHAADEPPAVGETRKAFPRIDCPDAVVVGKPFECVVGLSPQENPAVLSTGTLTMTGEHVSLEVLVTVDPESLQIAEGHRHPLTVDATHPFPSVTLHITALGRKGLSPDRRIAVHYFRDGNVIAIAWRRLLSVATEADLARTPAPETAEQDLLDLSPLLAVDAPDLVLAVYRADDAAQSRFVWAAYPCAAGIAVPDVKRAKDIGEDSRDFATQARRRIANPQEPAALFREMTGYGVDVAQAIPSGIQDVLRKVACQPGRSSAATVLLLTEEPYVPWEIAVLDPPLDSFGGTSPFLGAHVAIARWPLNEDSPHHNPQTTVEVRRQAVLTAHYGQGIPRWKRLKHAEKEAEDLARDFPPVAVVSPLWSDVVKCLEGNPPTDLLHVALHGQFDEQGLEDGLVLLSVGVDGATTAQFLTARQIRGLKLTTHPFVFLNACQVGAGNEILGSYVGMAVSILRAGARAVIAPLWNIDDAVASAISHEFYAAAYSPDPPPVAEILRNIRAGYTEATADGKGVTPTRIAYQLFGHPKLKLRRITNVP